MPRNQAILHRYSAVTPSPLSRMFALPFCYLTPATKRTETLRETRVGKQPAGGSHVSIEEGAIRVSVGAGMGTPTSPLDREAGGVAASVNAAARGGNKGNNQNDLRPTGLSVEVVGTANLSVTEVRVRDCFVASLVLKNVLTYPAKNVRGWWGGLELGEGRKMARNSSSAFTLLVKVSCGHDGGLTHGIHMVLDIWLACAVPRMLDTFALPVKKKTEEAKRSTNTFCFLFLSIALTSRLTHKSSSPRGFLSKPWSHVSPPPPVLA